MGVGICSRCALGLSLSMPLVAWGGYEPPNPAYLPPPSYYSSATGTGGTLKSQLHTIISTGVVSRTYDDIKYADQLLDRDPNNASNILLIYNRASVPAAWDGGTTWNREHQWPDSRGLNGSGPDYSDLFNLRPANQSINSSRSNDPYGTVSSSGSYGKSGSYFFPGDADKGDAARTLFYMATRYDGSQSGTLDLELMNGIPASLSDPHMGDLASLLKWHYTDGVDNFERRRNQYIYDKTLNPAYYQGNRNPFVDHPEYVWTIFGGGNNDSQLAVASPASDGSSTVNVDLGHVIKDATIPTRSVSIAKSGANPTTFDVVTTGTATSSLPGSGQTFDYNAQSRSMGIGLSDSTSMVGIKSGAVRIDNTDLTSGGAGRGSADEDDFINIIATVVDHSDARFAVTGSASNGPIVQSAGKSLQIDFGTVGGPSGPQIESFDVLDFASATFTAGLDLDGVVGSGDVGTLRLVGPTSFQNLAPSASVPFAIDLETSTAGVFSATYWLKFSDEDIPGASSPASDVLTLNVTAQVVPEPAFLSIALVIGLFNRRPTRSSHGSAVFPNH